MRGGEGQTEIELGGAAGGRALLSGAVLNVAWETGFGGHSLFSPRQGQHHTLKDWAGGGKGGGHRNRQISCHLLTNIIVY